jgi:hypothetical protein
MEPTMVATKIASRRHDCGVIPWGTGAAATASAEKTTKPHLTGVVKRRDARAPLWSSVREVSSPSGVSLMRVDGERFCRNRRAAGRQRC